MDKIGEIIAIGGGGFGRNPNKPIIEKYILDQSSADKPNICFFPTASAEDKSYIVNYYSAFSQLNCKPMHVNLFQRTPRLDSIINKQDIIYIGGGNTKSMLAVWREWKLDELLFKAYKRGVILCGVSAGAICWFEKGITDSWASNLNVMDCMGFLEGCCCPHYNGEKDRRPSLENMLKKSLIPFSYALDDGAALHYKKGKIHKAITFHEGAGAYKVFLDNDTIKHELIDSKSII